MAILFITPARNLSATTTPLTHDRLALQLNGAWKTAKQKNILRAQPSFSAAGGIILQPAVQSGIGTAPAFVEAVANRFEQGRRVVKKFPAQPRTGVTKSGVGFAFQTRVSRGVGNDVWFSAYYAFSAGAAFQTVIVLGKTEQVFQRLIKELAPPLDDIQIQLAKQNAGRGVALRKSYGFFNYKARLPAHWQSADGPVANVAQFTLKLKRQAYLAEPFQAAIELQLSRPNSPVAALTRFLESRVLWNYRGSYSSRTKLKLLHASDGRLPNGLSYVHVVLEKPIYLKDDDGYRKAGVLVYGPDCSILLGSAVQIDDYSRRFKTAQMDADLKSWGGVVTELFAVAGSLTFANDQIKRNPQLEQRLKSKKALRYQKEVSASSSAISFFSSTKVHWDFAGDGSVQYAVDRHRSFNAYDYNEIGRPDFSSGYLEGNAASGDARAQFSVWRNQKAKAEYIVVRYPSGLATFHPVVFTGNQFTIDGFRDGCCR